MGLGLGILERAAGRRIALIALVGGRPDAKVVAFDKLTGKELWRALSSESELGVAQPIIISAGGTRQLIIWYPGAVVSLDPATGKVYWEQPYKVGASMTVATPIHTGSLLFFTNFYDGPLMLALDEQKPAATVLWKGKSDNEIQTDGLHATTATPVIVGDYIYGICSYGQFRCLRAKTGERDLGNAGAHEGARALGVGPDRPPRRPAVHQQRSRRAGDREAGPGGYEEISRTFLLKPTSPPGNRREMVSVNWSHPAYANRHIYARNDEEIIAASLAASAKRDGK